MTTLTLPLIPDKLLNRNWNYNCITKKKRKFKSLSFGSGPQSTVCINDWYARAYIVKQKEGRHSRVVSNREIVSRKSCSRCDRLNFKIIATIVVNIVSSQPVRVSLVIGDESRLPPMHKCICTWMQLETLNIYVFVGLRTTKILAY